MDKKKIVIGFDKVINHGMEKIIPKMGFSGKGSLIIKIEVLFPKSLSADTKQRLQNILT